MKNQKTKFSLKIISFFKFIFISQILPAVILSSYTAEAKGFELYGIGLDTPVEQIERIAKEKKFELMASNKIEQQYKLEHYSVNQNPFDALVDILTLSPKYNENLFTLLKRANDSYIRESGMGDFSSFIDEKYLGKLYVIIGKNPDYNEKIECMFFDINGKPAMVEMRIWTLKTALLRDIIENYTKQYGKPRFIGANTPDADTPFDRKKPLNEYAEYIWKLNNEICKIGIRWSNTSGKLVIYNPEVISELMNFSIKTAQDIINGTYKYFESRFVSPNSKYKIVTPETAPNSFNEKTGDNKLDFNEDRFVSPNSKYKIVTPETAPNFFDEKTGENKLVFNEKMHKEFIQQSKLYTLANSLLNNTWQVIKNTLPEEAYRKILAEQRKWLSEGRDNEAAKYISMDTESNTPDSRAATAYARALVQRTQYLAEKIFEFPKVGEYENEEGTFSIIINENEITVDGYAGSDTGGTCIFSGKGKIAKGWTRIKGDDQEFFLLPTAKGIELFYDGSQGCGLNVSFAGFYKPLIQKPSIEEFEDKEIPEYSCPDDVLSSKTVEGVYKGIECGDYCYAEFEVGDKRLTVMANEEQIKNDLGAKKGVKAVIEYEISQFWVPEGQICRTAPVYKSSKPIK